MIYGLLVMQLVLAVLGLRAVPRVLSSSPAPTDCRGRPGPAAACRAVAVCWLPLALLLPPFCLAGRAGVHAGGYDWPVIGLPIGVGAMLMAVACPQREWSPLPCRGPGLLLVLGVSSLLFILLTAAHELTVVAGQCCLALAAVCLWWGGVSSAPPAGGSSDDGDTGVRRMLAAAGGQGACILLQPGNAGGAVMLITVLVAIAWSCLLAARMHPGWLLLTGGWVAGMGSLLGVGILSMRHLVLRLVGIITGGDVPVNSGVMRGMGYYRYECELLVFLLVLAWLIPHLSIRVRRYGGVLLGCVAGGLLLGRLGIALKFTSCF